jgi:hypothetical protein
MSDYTCGGSFCKFIAKLLALEQRKDDSKLCPKLKFVAGNKYVDKINNKAKQIQDLQEQLRKLDKGKDAAEIQKINEKIVRINKQQNKRQKLADVIDLSKFRFIEDLNRAMKCSKNEEELIQQIHDPELRGLVELTTSLNGEFKFEEIIKQYEFGNIELNYFREFVKQIAEIIGGVKKYKPKIFNNKIAKKIMKTVGDHEVVDFIESKKYFLNKYNEVFEACFKGYNEGTSIEELCKLPEFKIVKKDVRTDKLDENKKNIAVKIYEVLDLNDYKSVDKSKKKDLQDAFKQLNKIAKIEFNPKDIESFVEQLVSVINELKSLDLHNDFMKSVIKHTKIQLSNQTKYKLLNASSVKFVTPTEEAPMKKYNESKDKDMEMEFCADEFSNLESFEELMTIKTYSTFGSIKSLSLSPKIRAAVGIRMVTETLKQLQLIELSHHAKDGFIVSITY